MNSMQAREFVSKHSGPTVKSFVKASHLEELSPLIEVHIEAIEVRKDEFHDLQGSYNPRKETLDKFAQAAGISYNPTAETTRKEGDACYIGTAQAKVMGPDGKDILGPICEYEFDVDVRLAELEVNGKTEWVNNQKTSRAYSEIELKRERIQLLKVARMRANTGARNRATLAMLGMQTGFKGLFGKQDPDSATRVFLFSRCIVNAKNELVMNRMLDQIAGPTAALYGPATSAPQAIAAPVETATASEGVQVEVVADDWEDAPSAAPATPIDAETAELISSLHDYLAAGTLPQKGIDQIAAALDRGEKDKIILRDLVTRSKAAHERSLAARRAS